MLIKLISSLCPNNDVGLCFRQVLCVLFSCFLSPRSFIFDLKMRFESVYGVVSALVVAVNGQTQYTAPNAASVAAARATARTLSPTSYVKGKTFDRVVQIWLENTDFDMAQGDRMYYRDVRGR
jgi:hypothetical protein